MPDASSSRTTQGESPLSVHDPWIWGAVAIGFALRAWEAAESSLWFDELITLRRATMSSPLAVADSLDGTLHTPLFFASIQVLSDLSSATWLRVVPLLSSLLLVVLAALLARSCGWELASVRVATLLMAVTPYQIHYGAELRPYAWLAVSSAAASWLALTPRLRPRRDLVLFAAIALLGLANHRAMSITLLGILLARAFVRGPRLIPLVPLVAASALALLPFSPFFVDYALASHGDLARRAWRLSEADLGAKDLRSLALLPLRLLEPRLGMLGGIWTRLAFWSTLMVLGTAAVCGVSWLRARPRLSPPGRRLALLAITGFLLLTVLQLERRGDVAVQQYAGVAWVAPLALVALTRAVRSPAVRRSCQALLVLGGVGMGVALAGGHSRSDLRGGVALARAWADELHSAQEAPRAAPWFTAFVPAPRGLYPSAMLYHVWAPELEVVDPWDLPRPGEPGFRRPVLALRVVLDDPYPDPALPGRVVARRENLDRFVALLLYAPP